MRLQTSLVGGGQRTCNRGPEKPGDSGLVGEDPGATVLTDGAWQDLERAPGSAPHSLWPQPGMWPAEPQCAFCK